MELIATFLSLAPRATDDVLRRLDDQMLVVDLLENDLVYGATVTSYTQGSEGGQVSITPEGILTYQPPDVEAREIRGQTQPSLPTDTFTYTLENSVGSSVARVSVKTPPTIYVDAGAASGGNGSESQPFNDLKVALEAQTSQPCHIVLASGYYNVGELTLSQGQSIRGGTLIPAGPGRPAIWDNSNPPTILGLIRVATVDCSLENLIIAGYVGGGLVQPNIVGSGTFTGDPLLLKDLTLLGNDGEGIVLTNPGATQLTNISMTGVNQANAIGGLVIQAPLGTTTISGLSMDNTSVAGVVIRNTGAFDAHNTEAVAVILKNYTPKRVNNPLVVQADIGDLELHLSGLKSARDDSTSGTLITADVSGKAIVNAWLNSLDWARIGQGTGLLDWTYRDDSEGVVRIHETTAEFRDPGSNPEPTSLSFRTRDTSRGALVLSMVEFSWTTPVFLDAYDTSLMKVRLDQYLKAPDPAKKKFDPFEFHLSAHDRANIFSRINNYKGAAVYNSYASGLPTIPVHPLTGGFFIWRSELGAVQRIERATDIAIDNPYSMTAWFGFDNDGNEASQTRPDWALADMPRNYIDDTLDSLDIPNP